ncbi:hypothetical protein Cni_G02198 [Canna indica]|uniref:Uncharacterized protein n=1 Tax=Canna indica TaxID=4628 RepID=A0AAQ3JS21_9LILI|nr:hypothetical protein Cni_G02198 [Canna indica]
MLTNFRISFKLGVFPFVASPLGSPLDIWLSLWKPLQRIILDWDKLRAASWSKLRVDTETRIGALNFKKGQLDLFYQHWGDPISEGEGIASAFRECYATLLGKDIKPLLQIKWNLINEPHSLNLLCLDDPFTMTEVFEVIKAAKNFKSPGSYGLNMEFYMKFWPLIGTQSILFWTLAKMVQLVHRAKAQPFEDQGDTHRREHFKGGLRST